MKKWALLLAMSLPMFGQPTVNSYRVGVQSSTPNTPSNPMVIGQLCGSLTKVVIPKSVEIYGWTPNVNVLQVSIGKSIMALTAGAADNFAPNFIALSDSTANVHASASVLRYNSPLLAWSMNSGFDLGRYLLSTNGVIQDATLDLSGRVQPIVLHGVTECIDVSVAPLAALPADTNSYVNINWAWDEQ